jgi:hypothetical protein
MESSQRDFIKRVGLTGFAAMSLPEIFSEPGNIEPSKNINKNKGLTILFQGDSITDGNRTRDNDWNHIMGHG